MKKKIVLLTLVSVFLLSAMAVVSVAAQTRVPGVSAGDWFKYGDITFSWSSNDPNATWPPTGYEMEWTEEINETEWMRLSVEDVSGTNITFQATLYFKNGTDIIRSGWIDIDTGDSSNDTAETMDMGLCAIPANLDANDTIYASGPSFTHMNITERIVRTYPDGVRETNHLNMTYAYSQDEKDFFGSANFYWDRSTGILVEMSYEYIIQAGELLTTCSLLLRTTESNVWVVPEFPTWTSILLILIVLTIAVVIYKRRILITPIH